MSWLLSEALRHALGPEDEQDGAGEDGGGPAEGGGAGAAARPAGPARRSDANVPPVEVWQKP